MELRLKKENYKLIERCDEKLDQSIGYLDGKLEEKIGYLDGKLEEKIGYLDRKFSCLDEKLECLMKLLDKGPRSAISL